MSNSSTSRSKPISAAISFASMRRPAANGPALEHNGDLYTCDHFVEPGQKLGNIHSTPLIDLVASPQMRKFGDDKRDALTKQCRECDVRFLCNGGCPKDRFALSKDGEPGQITSAPGSNFLTHTRPLMGIMGQLLKRGRPPADVMQWLKAEDAKRDPYSLCPCGGGRIQVSATATRRARKRWRDSPPRPAKPVETRASFDALCAGVTGRILALPSSGASRHLVPASGAKGARHRPRMRSASGRGAAGSSPTGNLAASLMSRSMKKLRNVRMKATAARRPISPSLARGRR